MNSSSAERLLQEFAEAHRTLARSTVARLEQTLNAATFEISRSRSRRLAKVEATVSTLLAELNDAVVSRQLQHAASSPELNCWSVLGLQHSEVQHSLVLAWLLNSRASHAQGGLFLRELLRTVGAVVPIPAECTSERYRVATEVSHSRSRIDIEVMGKTFLLHIETKVNASEGEDQTCREREDLKAKARAKGIPSDRSWGIFLTADGSPCSDKEKFRPLSWTEVAACVQAACKQIRSIHPTNHNLAWVLDGYVEIIRRHVLSDSSEPFQE